MIKRFVVILLLLLTYTNCRSQSKVKQYRVLTAIEKKWVRHHPLAALKVFHINAIVNKEVNECSEKKLVDTLFNGGTADAFRHCYWMALCAQKIGIRKAISLGESHERGNREQFEKGTTDDAVLQDSISCMMDLYNNKVGAGIVQNINSLAKIEAGELKIMRRNNQNQFIDYEGNEVVKPKGAQRKWNLPYCLVPSNQYP